MQQNRLPRPGKHRNAPAFCRAVIGVLSTGMTTEFAEPTIICKKNMNSLKIIF